jgi:hypothetical protein
MAAAGGAVVIATFPGPPAVRITVQQVRAAMAAAELHHSGPAARAAVKGLLPSTAKDDLLTVLPAALLAGVGPATQKKKLTDALLNAILVEAGFPRQGNKERKAQAAAVMAAVSASLGGLWGGQ